MVSRPTVASYCMIGQRQREAATHSGIGHCVDDIERAHVRQRRAGIKMIHHAGAAGADHLDDAELRADIDRFVRIFAPAGADVLPPDLERQARPCSLEEIRRRVRMTVHQAGHHDARRGVDTFVEISVRPVARAGLGDSVVAHDQVTGLPHLHAAVGGHDRAGGDLRCHANVLSGDAGGALLGSGVAVCFLPGSDAPLQDATRAVRP